MSVNKSDLSGSKREKGDPFSMTRRTFLKVSAFTGAAVAAGRIIKYPEISSLVSPEESAKGAIEKGAKHAG